MWSYFEIIAECMCWEAAIIQFSIGGKVPKDALGAVIIYGYQGGGGINKKCDHDLRAPGRTPVGN